MSSWKTECGPCTSALQYGSYTAFLWFIVKQPGAVRGSVETWGEEGREVERRTGWAALIRSRETTLPPPQLATSDSNLSRQWQLLKAAWGFGGIMFDSFQISTIFFAVDVFSWRCLSRWQESINSWWITKLGILSTWWSVNTIHNTKVFTQLQKQVKTWTNQTHHLTLLTGDLSGLDHAAHV